MLLGWDLVRLLRESNLPSEAKGQRRLGANVVPKEQAK